MIYTSSLNIPVKKALGKQAMQSNLTKICEQLGLDPDTTNMDVVILGPRDLVGPKRDKVQKCIDGKHPDICVIYLYQKDNEADLINCDYKKRCKKISTSEITDAFTEFVGDHKIRQGKGQVTSADFDVMENDVKEGGLTDVTMAALPDYEEPEKEEVEKFDFNKTERPEVPVEEPPAEEEPELPPIDVSEFTESPKVPLDSDAHTPPMPENVEPAKPVRSEDMLANIHNFEDWGILKEHLNKDSIIKNLISENSEYVGLINMLEVLDQRITAVWRDTTLTSDQKFDKIKDIGLEKSVVRASANSINVEKVISIISTIILSAKRTVEEKVQSIDIALYKVTTDKSKLADTSYIDRAIDERSKVQIELLNLSRGIVDLYKSIDTLIEDEIKALDDQLPSSNAFINNMVKPIGLQNFTPANTAVLANRLMRCLQDNNLVASQLEESVNAIIENLFALCEKDEEIIRYQQNMINLLKANRVEDVIITNSLLKEAMRIFIGADNSGRSATAITWSGILARRRNTLVLDLTGHAKFRDYGVTPIPLEEFMNNRIEEPFLCVEAPRCLAPDEVQEMIQELKTRLNYYNYINVILAPEDKDNMLMLSEEAKTIHYITNCTTTANNIVKDLYAANTVENIARKLICIDTPVSPLMIADACGIDATQTKLVPLPAIPYIRACALRHDRPYEYSDVVKIFEEAFR